LAFPADEENVGLRMAVHPKPVLVISNLDSIGFESSPTPMWIYDVKSLAFLAVNSAAVRRYGYSHGEFLSMTILDIRPSDDVIAILRDTLSARRHNADREHWRHRTKAGMVLDVQITSREVLFDGRLAEIVTAESCLQP
jgi:PAS domain S-box-containing protein